MNSHVARQSLGIGATSLPAGSSAAAGLVVAALLCQAVLCFIHTHLHPISAFMVGLSEMSIFIACAAMLCRRSSVAFAALFCATMAYMLLLAIWRGQVDPKGFRDIMIMLLFFELGRQYADPKSADRLLAISILIVLAVALVELFFLDAYSKAFNIYSYYVSQGTLMPDTAWAKDSALSLNGTRPEGIGRTILPQLLGSHRISSVFLEPVSLGNFAVIVACWGLSKRRSELMMTVGFLLAAAVMIALSDSRYGMLTVAILIVLRVTLPKGAETAMIALPLACVATLLLVAHGISVPFDDNFLGRLSRGGHDLLGFDLPMLFGLDGLNLVLGDMGYPALLIRFGLPLWVFLWISFWLVRMRDDRGARLRSYAAIYMSLILCVSGSSMFALKSAAILWFLLGSSARPADSEENDAGAPETSPSIFHSARNYAG